RAQCMRHVAQPFVSAQVERLALAVLVALSGPRGSVGCPESRPDYFGHLHIVGQEADINFRHRAEGIWPQHKRIGNAHRRGRRDRHLRAHRCQKAEGGQERTKNAFHGNLRWKSGGGPAAPWPLKACKSCQLVSQPAAAICKRTSTAELDKRYSFWRQIECQLPLCV